MYRIKIVWFLFRRWLGGFVIIALLRLRESGPSKLKPWANRTLKDLITRGLPPRVAKRAWFLFNVHRRRHGYYHYTDGGAGTPKNRKKRKAQCLARRRSRVAHWKR